MHVLRGRKESPTRKNGVIETAPDLPTPFSYPFVTALTQPETIAHGTIFKPLAFRHLAGNDGAAGTLTLVRRATSTARVI